MRQNLPVTGREFPFPSGRVLVSVTDTKGRITYCNPGFVEVSGYSAEELLGQPHNIIRHPDMPAEGFRDLWATIEAGRPWSGFVKNRRKNGDHYWVQANAAPMVDGARIVGYLSVRTEAPREAVEAAEALYARINEETVAGRPTLALRQGRLVRLDPLGRLMQALRPKLRGQLLLGQFGAIGAAAAAAATLPPLAAVAVGAVAAGAAVALTWRLCVEPWRRVIADANRVAAGDLAYVVQTDGHGLVRAMQRALRQLSLNLVTSLSDFRTEIDALRSVAQEIATGNHDLATRTEAQSGSQVQAAASMEQIDGSARQTADSALQGTRVTDARQRMDEALAAVGNVSSLLGEISHAAREQQAGIGQINDAVTNMDAITQQNAAMVRQLAASAATLLGNVQAVTTTMGLFRVRAGDRTAAEVDAVALRRQARAAQAPAPTAAAAADPARAPRPAAAPPAKAAAAPAEQGAEQAWESF